MKHFYTVLIIVLLNVFGNSQPARNANWLIGYPPNNEVDSFGGAQLKFTEDSLSIDYFETPTFLFSHSFLNDENGELICYTDGCKIFDKNHDLIINGDSINYSFEEDYWAGCNGLGGYITWQGQLFLPIENNENAYLLIHLRVHKDLKNMDLMYTKIYKENDQLIVAKKNILIETINEFYGFMTAIKHANGRDWWLVLPKRKEGILLTILISNNLIGKSTMQKIGNPALGKVSGSQLSFSPNGKLFAVVDGNAGLDIYNFDRCAGTFFHAQNISNVFSKNAVGISFSPNSKYLYASNTTYLWQFELVDNKLNETPILIDTYDGAVNPIPTTFYQSKLAPNNKIYIAATNGIRSMHVINEPNQKGKNCDFVQNGVILPVVNIYSMPNSPLFRVGPIDGSICDTLGINSTPVARFYPYASDTIDGNYLFTNASYFGPSDYYWDFGDGYRSYEFEPEHTYTKSGNYEVCLTASNDHTSDTYCETISVDLINETSEPEKEQPLLYPNPISTGPLNLILPKLFEEELIFEIFLANGQFIFDFDLDANAFNHFLNIDPLQNNMYFYRITKSSDGTPLYTGKFLKNR